MDQFQRQVSRATDAGEKEYSKLEDVPAYARAQGGEYLIREAGAESGESAAPQPMPGDWSHL